MYSVDKENNSNNIEIEIHPISKWKRILLFLSDTLITYFVSVLLLSVVIAPIGFSIFPIDEAGYTEASHKCNDILIENNLLFYAEEEDKYNFDNCLSETCDRWISYYCLSSYGDSTYKKPCYGNLISNNSIYTYFHTIVNDDDLYYDLFEKENNQDNLFSIVGNTISLDETITNEVKYYFIVDETLSEVGKNYYEKLSNMFSALYGDVTKNILSNDLTTVSGDSFVANYNYMNSVADRIYMLISIFSLVSFVIAWLLVYILYPVLTKNVRTPSISIFKIDRVGFNNLLEINKRESFLISCLYLVFNLCIVLFIPLSYISTVELLKLPILPILTILSLLVVIISLFVCLFSNYNRTLIDVLTNTVFTSTEEIDMIYKTKETIKESQNQKV